MNGATGNRNTRLIIIALVILNLVLLATFWYSRLSPKETTTRQQPPKHTGPPQQDRQITEFLENELNFTQDQADTFIRLRNDNRMFREQLRRQMDELRKEMMDQLLEENPDHQKVEQLAAQMGQTLTRLESSMFYHLQELMNICNDEQKKKYRAMMREILERLRPPDHRGGPPGQRPPPEGMDRDRKRRRPPPPHDRQRQRPPHPPPDRH
jgi:Spy/CpxP family protein refolding chaperone